LHEFDEKIGDNAEIDTGAEVQQYPSPDELCYRAAKNEHELGSQHNIYERCIAGVDANVHNRLGKKREDQLDQTTQQKTYQKLNNKPSVCF
jgi:hypothetical protein